MKHALWLVVLAGCSLRFDPERAPPQACPAGVAACAARPNSTPRCDGDVCAYTCAAGFADADSDSTTGCELSCTEGDAPTNPERLVAEVGAASGEIRWTWPEAAGAPAVYRLCTGLSAATTSACRDVASSACADGTCTFVDQARPDFVRVHARVQSVDACGRGGPLPTAPTTSASPIRFAALDAGWTLDAPAGCTVSLTTSGDELGIEQTGFNCTSALLAPDDGWADARLDVDVRISSAAPNIDPGLALLANVQGFRLLATVANATALEPLKLRRRKPATSIDDDVASSLAGITPGTWAHVSVLRHGHVLAVSLGADDPSASERLRWFDPGGAGRSGRLGLVVTGNGRADFRRLRVSTSSAPETMNATRSVSYRFGPDGGLPDSARATASVERCPLLPEGAGCAGTCAPAADAQCLHLRPLQTASLAPPGLDPARPWSVSVRFATPPDAGSFFPNLLSVPSGPLISTSQWAEPVAALGVATPVTVQTGTWNTATLRIDPPTGQFSFSFNGAERLTGPLPNNREVPAGVLRLGGYSIIDAFVERVDVSQPP